MSRLPIVLCLWQAAMRRGVLPELSVSSHVFNFICKRHLFLIKTAPTAASMLISRGAQSLPPLLSSSSGVFQGSLQQLLRGQIEKKKKFLLEVDKVDE